MAHNPHDDELKELNAQFKEAHERTHQAMRDLFSRARPETQGGPQAATDDDEPDL